MLPVLAALLATLAIELGLVRALAPRIVPGAELGRLLAGCVALNLVSHPLACAAAPVLGLGVVELLVLALEGCGLASLFPAQRTRAFLLALVANGASASAALLWPG
jgi:hypothetical protein